MRVLFVTSRLSPWVIGGTAEFEGNLVKYLSRLSGVSLTLLGTCPPGVAVGDYYPKSVKVMAVPIKRYYSAIDVVTSSLVFPLSAHKQRFDIVHFNVLPGLRGGTLALDLIFGRRKPRLVVNLHGHKSEILAYTNSLSGKLASSIHWNVSEFILHRFDAVVVASSHMSSHAKTLGLPSRLVRQIPYGVDDDLVHRNASKIGNTILCYGHLNYIKGQDLLIRAFAKSTARRAYRLKIIGSGNPSYRRELDRLIKDFGLDSCITIVDEIDHEQLMNEVAAAPVCVFPSRQEGFNIGALEAMALRATVIASRNGGPVDYIRHGVNGFLVNPNDTSKMASLLDKACNDDSLRNRIGAEARITADGYRWSKVAERYLALYESLLQKPTGYTPSQD